MPSSGSDRVARPGEILLANDKTVRNRTLSDATGQFLVVFQFPHRPYNLFIFRIKRHLLLARQVLTTWGDGYCTP